MVITMPGGEIEPYYTEGHSQDSPCSDWRPRTNPVITGYYWESYKWCNNGDSRSLTKYNTVSNYGAVDNKTSFKDYDYEDDAAHAALGGNWRMPTDAEWEELRKNCTWTWTRNYNGTGVAGRIVTSNKTGYTNKSIFLPASGDRYGTVLDGVGTIGSYWSSSLYSDPRFALGAYGDSNGVGIYRGDRIYGHPVRPVSEL